MRRGRTNTSQQHFSKHSWVQDELKAAEEAGLPLLCTPLMPPPSVLAAAEEEAEGVAEGVAEEVASDVRNALPLRLLFTPPPPPPPP